MIRFGSLLRSSTVTTKLNPRPQVLAEKCFSTNKSGSPPSSSSSSSSTSSSSSDDERKKSDVKKKSAEAREKLNLLLNTMIKEDAPTHKDLKLDLARPGRQRQKDVRREPGTESVKTEPVEQRVVKAVKDVAESIGGDVKQTESELLQKLLNPVKDEVAQPTANNLSEIFKDMKIDRQTKAGEEVSRAQQVRQLLQGVKRRQTDRPAGPVQRRAPRERVQAERRQMDVMEERVNLFGGEGLGIFPSPSDVAKWDGPQLKTWKSLQERELRLAVTHPPANYFQQMILWTDQGKLWKFPIDNEQGLETEQNVDFAEHVFLEKHLESWCPPKGPVRHFMELVCVGLSKNPYLTVEKKKEHIAWFRDYFAEKKQLLHEVGAIAPDFDISKQDAKQIDS